MAGLGRAMALHILLGKGAVVPGSVWEITWVGTFHF